jgi:hypothetical protein
VWAGLSRRKANRQHVSANVDLLAAFSADPPGMLVLRHHRDGDEIWATVRRADPHVEFTHSLLLNVLSGCAQYPEIRLQPPDDARGETSTRFRGWLLHVDARDRHVVYQIGDYNAAGESWHAAWPD